MEGVCYLRDEGGEKASRALGGGYVTYLRDEGGEKASRALGGGYVT